VSPSEAKPRVPDVSAASPPQTPASSTASSSRSNSIAGTIRIVAGAGTGSLSGSIRSCIGDYPIFAGFAANGHHESILVVRFDSNPRNSMSAGDVARAVGNLENAGVPIADSYFELNHWQ
jgi:hypothetical protein